MLRKPDVIQSAYMFEIGWMRAFALLLVVLGHLVQRFVRFQGYDRPISGALSFLNMVFGNPAAGVLLFFSISGFLIGTQFLRRDFFERPWFNIRRYFARRIVRVVLPYVVLTLASYGFIRLFGLRVEQVNLFDVPPSSLEESLLATLSFSHEWAFGTYPRLFPPGWSLEIEIQFYLVMPALMYFYARGRPPAAGRLATGLAMFGVAVALAFFSIEPSRGPLNYSLAAFMPYLWLGVLLADARAGSENFLRRPGARHSLVPTILFSALFITSGPLYFLPALHMLIKLAVIAALFVCFHGVARGARGFRPGLFMAGVNKLSYPIYLTHLQVIQIVTPWIFTAFKISTWPAMFVFCLLVELPLVVGVAYLFHAATNPLQRMISPGLFLAASRAGSC